MVARKNEIDCTVPLLSLPLVITNSHVQVAVKVIRNVSSKVEYCEQLKMVNTSTPQRICSALIHPQKLLREAKLWSQLDHSNITPFYGICFDLGLPSAPCLVCPYFKNGNVAAYLEDNPDADRMRLVRYFCT
jgi:serine/threonine protein kinase